MQRSAALEARDKLVKRMSVPRVCLEMAMTQTMRTIKMDPKGRKCERA